MSIKCLTDCGGQACAKPSDGSVPIVSKPNSVQALPQINQKLRCHHYGESHEANCNLEAKHD